MRNLFLFLAVVCVVVAILPNDIQSKTIRRQAGYNTLDDEQVTVIPLPELLATYDIHKHGNVTRRQFGLPGLPSGIVISYMLFATCEYIAFWAMEFSGKFTNGWMELKYYTDPQNIPTTWQIINQNTMFSFAGAPTFTITLGPYDPCTTVYIQSVLKRPDGLTKMGNMTLETDCPCDPGSGQGDPHYLNFEKHHIEFNGDCSYVLTETCVDSPYYLKVVAKHGELVNRFSNTNARRIESAEITTNNHNVFLGDNGVIKINGEIVNVYDITPDAEIGIQMVDNITGIIFSADAKWWVEWTKNVRNNRNILYVGIHKDSDLIGKMCGMLGEKLPANHPKKEFIGYKMRNGDYTYDINEHGDSWVVPGSCP